MKAAMVPGYSLWPFPATLLNLLPAYYLSLQQGIILEAHELSTNTWICEGRLRFKL
jgi:hypothetical protein